MRKKNIQPRDSSVTTQAEMILKDDQKVAEIAVKQEQFTEGQTHVE